MTIAFSHIFSKSGSAGVGVGASPRGWGVGLYPWPIIPVGMGTAVFNYGWDGSSCLS